MVTFNSVPACLSLLVLSVFEIFLITFSPFYLLFIFENFARILHKLYFLNSLKVQVASFYVTVIKH